MSSRLNTNRVIVDLLNRRRFSIFTPFAMRNHQSSPIYAKFGFLVLDFCYHMILFGIVPSIYLLVQAFDNCNKGIRGFLLALLLAVLAVIVLAVCMSIATILVIPRLIGTILQLVGRRLYTTTPEERRSEITYTEEPCDSSSSDDRLQALPIQEVYYNLINSFSEEEELKPTTAYMVSKVIAVLDPTQHSDDNKIPIANRVTNNH